MVACAAPAGAWANYNQSGESNFVAATNGAGRFDGKKFSFAGTRLDTIDWNGRSIVPVNKEFLTEHPKVMSLSYDACQEIRLRHSIHATAKGCDVPKPVEVLEEAPFPQWVVDVLRAQAFVKPTPIQIQAWPAALKGHDIIGIAETGSGKTLAYVVPMLIHINSQPELKPNEGPVGLVLVPNRELSKQVKDTIDQFADGSHCKCEAISGGENEREQVVALVGKVDIIVATPGRLISLLNNRLTNLARVTYVVIDEADEMLAPSFYDQVMPVMTQIRPDRQVVLFSATWDDRIEEAAHKLCKYWTVQIHVGTTKLAACKNIEQMVKMVEPNETKMDVLLSALKLLPQGHKALVFVNSRQSVPDVVEEIQRNQMICEGFNGACTQEFRTDLLRRFNDQFSSLQVLVSTQILGRGFDFPELKFVINYDMPRAIVEYIHRIGRTGRAGRKGFSLTILTDEDLQRCGRDLKNCLDATDQNIPNFLFEACSRRRRGRT
eukprot:TRINITY_DN35208_c0_g1_i1.p1 TRINITY_DN35208_c0_g1~~TRINITY_DN35208_c0_g1_i1.p1  ORF type:complete len:509 (-),score=65.95 TRINITY_DN35208_c0_g1_i1:39-1514(-)